MKKLLCIVFLMTILFFACKPEKETGIYANIEGCGYIRLNDKIGHDFDSALDSLIRIKHEDLAGYGHIVIKKRYYGY